MRALKNVSYFLTGFTVATAACMALRATPAGAQTLAAPIPETTISAPKSSAPSQGVSTRTKSVASSAPSAPTLATPRRNARQPADLPANGATTPNTTAEVIQDGDDPARWLPTADRLDGDPEPTAPQGVLPDGVPETIIVPTTNGPGDEIDPHGRQPGDRDAFALPPTDFDHLAFQIELDPANDARTTRLARFEPYSPRGIRSGSWVILPEISTGIGASSNILRSPNRHDGFVFDVQPTLRAVTNWRQHAIDIRATGLASSNAGEHLADERTYAFEARGRLDISRRTNIEVLVAHRRDVDSVGNPADLTAVRGRPNYDTNQAAVTVNHRFNRLSLQLRGAISDVDFQPAVTNAGALLSNNDRDLIRRDLAVRASWSLKPALALFTEYAINEQAYKTLGTDGASRDSTGDRIRFGVSFGNTAKIWRGEIAAGYGRQQAKDNSLANADGLIVDANLAWRPSEVTSVLFQSRTDFTTSTDAGQALARQQLLGLEVRHAFQRHLIGSAALRRQHTAYEGTAISETETTAELGAEYWLSNATSLTARYQHIWFDTTAVTGDYTVDAVRVGMRWRP